MHANNPLWSIEILQEHQRVWWINDLGATAIVKMSSCDVPKQMYKANSGADSYNLAGRSERLTINPHTLC